jgi:hypothetical protein
MKRIVLKFSMLKYRLSDVVVDGDKVGIESEEAEFGRGSAIGK